MRLLNSTTLKLHEFVGSKIPPYVILSHTWGEEEVSFQELQSGGAAERKGFEKVKRCCEIAAGDGFEYAWVDTCCIDKTSSAELSEAINSMFLWYKQAEVCYAFLSDVPSDEDPHQEESAFRKSRWFTRGWTLQELIAPSYFIFLGLDWKEIGTKLSLQDLVSEITKIQIDALVGNRSLKGFSVAQKMSWASSRDTTRKEDIAYCLLGILGIHMPMLYGEGEKAFLRLQEQIIANFEDDSIFAWWDERARMYYNGLLAFSPESFARSGNVISACVPEFSSKYSWNNDYIRWKAHVMLSSEHNYSLAMLRCGVLGDDNLKDSVLAISLRSVKLSTQESVMVRVDPHVIHSITVSEMHQLQKTTISVMKFFNVDFARLRLSNETRAFHFRYIGVPQRQVHSIETYPRLKRQEIPPMTFGSLYPILGIRFLDTAGLICDVLLLKTHRGKDTLTALVIESRANEMLEDIFWSCYGNCESIARAWDHGNQKPVEQWPKTSDRILQLHSSGAKTTVTIKKVGREPEHTGSGGMEGSMIEKLFIQREYEGHVIESFAGDQNAPAVQNRYLIEVKLE